MVIGGEVGIRSDLNEGMTDSVRTFNIDTKQWGIWPGYPLPSKYHRVIFINGLIYAAGGQDSEGYVEKIFKMEASSEGSWEEFATLEEGSENPYLIYYNN